MDGETRDIDEGVLLAQLGWVRGLAERLVRDRSLAEDLAQETLLTALSRPPSARDSEVSLRAWLSRVLRNLAGLGERSRRRRLERELLVARAERTASTDDVVSRAADQHQIVAAVLALEEPYRSVVLLRFFDELPVARIAEQTGATPAAVRKQLSRAMAILRARLESDYETRGQSLAIALLSLCAGGRAGSSSLKPASALFGAETLAAGVAALALCVLGSWSWWGASEEATVALTPPQTRELPLEQAIAAPAAARVTRAQAGESIASANAAQQSLHVRFAADLAPAEGARVVACVPESVDQLRDFVEQGWKRKGIESANAERWLDLMRERAVPSLPTDAGSLPLRVASERELGATDSAGMFAVEALAENESGLLIEDSNAVPVFVPAACLEASADTHVIDADGLPVEGAFVRIELDFGVQYPDKPRPWFDSLSWHGPTDASGDLKIDGLPAGTSLFVVPLGDLFARPRLAHVDPQSLDSTANLTVWRVGSATGRIAWADGSPGRDLTVSFSGRYDPRGGSVPRVETAEDGSFRLDGVCSGAGRLNIAQERGISSVQIEIPASRDGDLGTIILPELTSIEGVVTGADLAGPSGSMGARPSVQVYRNGAALTWRGLGADGRFAFELPRGQYQLVVQMQGGFGDCELLRRSVACPSTDVVLDVGRDSGRIRGQLPEGMPDTVSVAARVYLGLDELSPPDSSLGARTFTPILVSAGAFEFGPIPPGEWDIEVALGEFGTRRIPGVVLEAGRTTNIGVIDPSATDVHGRVTTRGGEPVANARVMLLAPNIRSVFDDAKPQREVRTKQDGSFRFSSVDARQWHVYATLGEELVAAPVLTEVQSGAAHRLDIELVPPCFIEGRVTRSGVPVEGAVVMWKFVSIPDLKFTPFGSPTAFRCVADEAGRYRLGPLLPRPCGLRAGLGDATVEIERLQLVPGRDEAIDFELAPVRARLKVELPVDLRSLLTSVRTHSRFGGSTAPATTIPGVLESKDLISVALTPGPTQLELILVSDGDWRVVHAVVDGSTAKNGDSVVIPSGTVELRLPPGEGDAPLPKLHLLAVPDWKLPAPEVAVWLEHPLPVARDGDVLTYHGVPNGARLRLIGQTGPGPRVSREFVYEGPGPLQLRWP
jgi:RNA polymerase sigma-70 factor (ECF subfamily)